MQSFYAIFPLGDAAITLDLGNHIDERLNRKVLFIRDFIEGLRLEGIGDIIVAYSSVSVFYDVERVRRGLDKRELDVYNYIGEHLRTAAEQADEGEGQYPEGALIRVPVCYGQEYGPDLPLLAAEKGLKEAEVIELHCAEVYRVYMIGFLPGFSYLGKVDSRIEIGRKQQPVPVKAGGVGIAGNQTGIYPLNSPGGWQIIGRTPWPFFDRWAEPPVRFKVGDRVQFYAIGPEEFRDAENRAEYKKEVVVPSSMPFKTISDQCGQ